MTRIEAIITAGKFQFVTTYEANTADRCKALIACYRLHRQRFPKTDFKLLIIA